MPGPGPADVAGSEARARLTGMDPQTDAIVTTIVVIAVFAALCAALVLVTLSLRRPRGAMLAAAAAIVTVALVVLSILPFTVPVVFGVLLALPGVALAVVGGDPFTRWVLGIADGGRTSVGPRGGILVEMMAESAGGPPREEEILRGGTTIGYLERACTALGIVAGFPGAVAVVVAVKGVGRFTELATPAARERFIVGTLASLLWACAVAGVVWLAIW